MIVALEPIRQPRLGETCVITPRGDEEGDHRGAVMGTMIVHVKLPIGVVELTMCGSCLGELIEYQQDGEMILRLPTEAPF